MSYESISKKLQAQQQQAKDAQILLMTMQIKMLKDAFATLTKSLTNKENAPPNMGNTNNGTTPRAFHWTPNMRAYCWLHGHHPVGAKHTSCTCTKEKVGHINNETATSCQGGDNFWLKINKVKESQQDYPKFKGKTAPTN
jgi:hypothetical protein